ncbi:MAG: M48 family metalloprotease, partial [Terriglobia bacterium]
GTLSPAGQVNAETLVFWKNPADKAKAKLLRQYEPRLHLPGEPSSPTTLLVGKARYRLYANPVIQRYVERVGTELVSTFRSGASDPFRHLNFSFFLAHDIQPGAAAYPSGVVVVPVDLLYVVENEAQLAFLLAHEIAHVTQQHAWRQWHYHRRKLRFLRWATAHLSWVVEKAIRKGYERELENQADRLALAYMVRAGYDPREAYQFLQRLEAVWRFGLSPLLWSSHESFLSRRSSIMAVIQTTHRNLAFHRLETNSEAFAAVRFYLPEAQIKTAIEQDAPRHRKH